MHREMDPFDLMTAAEERIRDIDILYVKNSGNIGMLAILQAERAALVAVMEMQRMKWEDSINDEFDRLTGCKEDA